MSGERHARKAQLIELVLRLRDYGVHSPELIGEALGVSRTTVWRILATCERRAQPRHDVRDLLAGRPANPELRAAIDAWHAGQAAQPETEVLTEIPAENVEPV